jgi:prepilin signal peptidase PulO-like enzyme (type II secretory pathway)
MSIHIATLSANGVLVARSTALLGVVIVGGLIGLLFGSFLNVVIYRVPARISLSYPPSHCPECKHPISALENIPVVSWLVLRGKCRYCKRPIPLRYPATELATGTTFALAGAIRVAYLSQLRSPAEMTTLMLTLFAQWTAIAAVIALTGLALEDHVSRGRSLLAVPLAQVLLLGIATSVTRRAAPGTTGSDALAMLAAVAMTAALAAAWIVTTKRSRSGQALAIDRVGEVPDARSLQNLLALLLAGAMSATWCAPASLALWVVCAIAAYRIRLGYHPTGTNHRLSVLIASWGMLIGIIWSGVGAGSLAKWP